MGCKFSIYANRRCFHHRTSLDLKDEPTASAMEFVDPLGRTGSLFDAATANIW